MQTLVFDDFDEFAATIRDSDQKITLQNFIQPHWSIQHLDAAGIHIQKADEGSGDITVGCIRPDGYVFIFPIGNAGLHSVNGVTLQAASVAILEPGCDYCFSTSADHEWGSVFIPTEMLTLGPDQPAGKCRLIQSSMGPVHANHVQQYLALVRRILDSALHCPDVVSSGAIGDALLDLREMSSRFLGEGAAPASKAGRPPIPREEIIRRIRLALESHENLPLSPRELAQAADVSERTLRDVFQHYFRVSAGRYLQLRQLQQVHRALRNAEPGSVLVSEVMVQCGVWEFGRFAHRYREAFGELPSMTLTGPRTRVHRGTPRWHG